MWQVVQINPGGLSGPFQFLTNVSQFQLITLNKRYMWVEHWHLTHQLPVQAGFPLSSLSFTTSSNIHTHIAIINSAAEEMSPTNMQSPQQAPCCQNHLVSFTQIWCYDWLTVWSDDSDPELFLNKDCTLLIQLYVVFASKQRKGKKKKTLAISPFIPLTLQIMLTKGSTYKYVINCINIFTYSYKLIRW